MHISEVWYKIRAEWVAGWKGGEGHRSREDQGRDLLRCRVVSHLCGWQSHLGWQLDLTEK